jgi:hypothetical protein
MDDPGATTDAMFTDQEDLHIRLEKGGFGDTVDLWLYVEPSTAVAEKRWSTYALADFGKLRMSRVANVIYEHTGSLEGRRYWSTLGCLETLAGRQARV